MLGTIGCGGSAPDSAAVKKQMTSDQVALGDLLTNSVGMTLVPIPSGEFQMGTPQPKPDKSKKDSKKKPPQVEISETPQHLVKITKPFYIGVCEVTQEQYETVMGESPWIDQPLVYEGENYAASYVSWENAVQFCKKLSDLENATYRLPTEAEWEYACRAGTNSPFSFGDDGKLLGQHAWYDVNAYKDGKQYPHRVGQKLPNSWALYDMHGNVCEWCSDWYGPFGPKREQAVDPTGPEKGWIRVWRGGSFSEAGINIRSATRVSFGRVDYRPEFAAGFRVVKEMP